MDKVTLLQEENLVRFLNAVDRAPDMVGVLDDATPEMTEQAGKALAVRDELGAFFNLSDVEKALDLKTGLGGALLRAARRPLMMLPPAVTYVDKSLLASIAPLIFGRISFDIDIDIEWKNYPGRWRDGLSLLGFEIGNKQGLLEEKLREARERIPPIEARIREQKATNQDTSRSEGALDVAQRDLAALEAEVEALNKACSGGNHKAAWAIVRRNLIIKRDQKRREAANINPTSNDANNRKNLLNDEADAIDRQIAKIDDEVKAFKP